MEASLRVKQNTRLLDSFEIGIMDDSSDSSAFICKFNIDKSGNLISVGSTELKDKLDVEGLTTLKGGLTIGGTDTNIDSNMTVKREVYLRRM